MRVVILALTLIATPAMAETYLGFQFGESVIIDGCHALENCQDRDTSGGVVVGHRIQRDIILEVQALRLGSLKAESVDVDIEGIGAHLMLGGNLNEWTALHVLGGAVRYRAEADGIRAYETEPYVGLAFTYLASDTLRARIQFQRFDDIGGRYLGMYSAGLMWVFR